MKFALGVLLDYLKMLSRHWPESNNKKYHDKPLKLSGL